MEEGSPRTSRNQLAAGFKKVDWTGIKYNFDLGGGKYDKATKWLKDEHGVTNLVFDPYNRHYSHNVMVCRLKDKAETSTLFNVLNIHPLRPNRNTLLEDLKNENTKHIYITVYEKKKTGEVELTRDGWQTNMKLKDYLPEVHEIYPGADIKNGMIIINL